MCNHQAWCSHDFVGCVCFLCRKDVIFEYSNIPAEVASVNWKGKYGLMDARI